MTATATPAKRDSLQLGLFFNLLGQVATVASGAVISILLARHYGASLLGQWSVALVYASLVGMIVEGGLGRVLMRDAARDPAMAGRALGTVLKGRLLLGIVTVPAALATAALLGITWTGWLLAVLLVVGRWIEGIQSSYQAALFTLGDHRTPNLLETGRRLLRVFAVGAIVLLGGSILWAGVAMLVTAILTNGVLVRATSKRVQVDFSGSLRSSWREAAWFWANGVLFWINSEISVLIVSQLAGDRVTGIYAAATRLAALFLIIPRAMNNSIIPKLFRSAKTGEGLHRQLSSSALFLTALGGLIAVEATFAGPQLIALIYGSDFLESGLVFQISGLFLFINFARIPATWYLSTSDRVRLVTVAMGLGSIANVAAGLWLVPRLGASGAAWAAVLSESVLAAWALFMTARYTGHRVLIATLLGTVPAFFALGLHLVLAPHVPWLVASGTIGLASVALLYVAGRRILSGWNPFGLME